MKPIIIAGGFGRRLWPLSTDALPKQFIKIFDEYSSYQLTLLRTGEKNPLVVINIKHQDVATRQAFEVNVNPVFILEPYSKNTFASIVIAASFYDNEKVVVMSADHIIDPESFVSTLEKISDHIEDDKICLLGKKPTFPHTGYGYIEIGEKIFENINFVKSFKEKPNLDLANRYLLSQNFLWNMGTFIFNSKMFNAYQKCISSQKENSIFLNLEEFEKIPSNSIDYILLENAENLIVASFDGDWTDVGSFESIYHLSDKDSEGNVGLGQFFYSNNNYVKTTKNTVCIGLDGFAIVESEDGILVSKLELTDFVKNAKQDSYNHRPWGYYTIISKDDTSLVKKLVIHPKHRISTQYHNFRSESWTILQGAGDLLLNDQIRQVGYGDNVFIPPKVVHTVYNTSNIDLIILEVQTGTKLSEDDIVRLHDDYGRT